MIRTPVSIMIVVDSPSKVEVWASDNGEGGYVAWVLGGFRNKVGGRKGRVSGGATYMG